MTFRFHITEFLDSFFKNDPLFKILVLYFLLGSQKPLFIYFKIVNMYKTLVLNEKLITINNSIILENQSPVFSKAISN